MVRPWPRGKRLKKTSSAASYDQSTAIPTPETSLFEDAGDGAEDNGASNNQSNPPPRQFEAFLQRIKVAGTFITAVIVARDEGYSRRVFEARTQTEPLTVRRR